MTDTSTAFLRRRGVDDRVAVGARRVVMLLLLGVLALDAVIAAALGRGPEPTAVAVDNTADLRALMQRAANDREPWILIGGSVLVGRNSAGQRVIDQLRRQQALDSAASFHEVALDGLLPIDILHIVSELDRVDPEGRVQIAIELSPRYASRRYAEQSTCSQAWLCEAAAPAADVPSLTEYVPVARHFVRLAARFRPTSGPGADAPADQDPADARARALEEYRDLVLTDESTQIAALRETLVRVRATGRRAVLFTSPVEDTFAAAASGGSDPGALVARWAELVEESDSTATMVSLDHPLFATPLFVDHCNLRPEGNRLLALNLLHELGVGLDHVPQRSEVAHPEGPNATLVSRIDMGSAQGPAWQAAFQDPQGIAVHRGADRVVVADTGNHCLRELRGNLDTVRTVAGAPGARGNRDGPAGQARLDGPTAPCFHADAVYFATDGGRVLRSVSDGHVTTLALRGGPQWTRISQIRSDASALYLLDAGSRILRLDPSEQRSQLAVAASEGEGIRAFDVTPDGRIFVVDRSNRIWQASTAQAATVGADPEHAARVFDNTAQTPLPVDKDAYFPFTFDEVQLRRVVDLHWVERYDALLVADDIPLTHGEESWVTERIHLRLISIEERLVYPWLQPLKVGGGHIMHNAASDSLVSQFHSGALALDQASAATFYLEHSRSRLFRIGDGVLGAALTGNTNTNKHYNGTREYLGPSSGDAALVRFRPDQHLEHRVERLHREGPYLGVMLGSSMIGISDNVGMYALGRQIESLLQDALGYRDKIRFDLIVRSHASISFARLITTVEKLVESSIQPDVVFIEVRGIKNHFRKSDTDAEVIEYLQRLRVAVERTDALLVYLDNTAQQGRGRDALRVGARKEVGLVQLIRDAGFIVIDPGDLMLEDHLRVMPWASPPFGWLHPSPWGVDATAERFAALLYPRLREHLRGRVPSRHRPLGASEPVRETIGPVLGELDEDWDDVLLRINPGVVQHRDEGGELELFVDLAKLASAEYTPSAEQFELVALSCMRDMVRRNPGSALATRVNVRLAEFSNYDEYGLGSLEGATIQFESSYDADALRALIEEVR